MRDSEASEQARKRVEPILAEVCAEAGIDTLPLRITRGSRRSSAHVGVIHGTDRIEIAYPAARLAIDTDAQIRGTLAHEVSHATLGHVVPTALPKWMQSPARFSIAVVSSVIPVGVLTGWAALSLIPGLDSWTEPGSTAMAGVLFAFTLGGIIGVAPWVVYVNRAEPSRPGWEASSSQERELAADVAAVRLVGKHPLVATLERRVPRTRLGRFWERLTVDRLGKAIATHPSNESRVRAITSYDGSEPQEYAQRMLGLNP